MASESGSTIMTTLGDYNIVTAPSTAMAGRVVFDIHNAGNAVHEFAVIKTTKPAKDSLDQANPNSKIAGNVGAVGNIAGGATKQLVIKNLAAGHYALVCALPGHYQSGMYADFTVN